MELPLLPVVSHDWVCRCRGLQTFHRFPSGSSPIGWEREKLFQRWENLKRLDWSPFCRSQSRFRSLLMLLYNAFNPPIRHEPNQRH